MADRMIRRNYEAMIEALYSFGARTAQIGNDIQDAANKCRNVLEEEDSSIVSIYEHATRSQRSYNEVALRALKIAKAMSEELEKGELERMVWEDED